MAPPVHITFLGGLGEIGRNCMVLELEGRMVVLDCGQMFVDDHYPGVNSVLPDFSYLLDNADRIDGIIATHCHEDHIGGLPYLFADLQVPIFGSAFTLGMVSGKLEQEDFDFTPELIELKDGDRRKIGPFDCEFLPVTHSTPSGLITAFHTPQGVILHSSDFKLDLTPVDGRRTNLSRIGALGHDPGVRLLLCDSTNADQPGQSSSESSVGAVIAQLVHEHSDRRLIFGAFSSHIHRLQQIADAVVPHGRIVVPLGRSMLRNFALARELGMLRIPDANVGTEADIARSEPHEICVVCTGSQAEPRAALSVMASGDSKYLDFGPTDTVVFSSHPIPGNESAVSRLRSNILRTGALVVHSGHVDVHTTGHGKQHELRTLHSVAAPEWFVPVHGEYEHLVAHVEVAKSLMPDDRIVFAQDGEQIVLDDDGTRLTDQLVPAGHIYTDGHIGFLDGTVIHERRILRDGGFVAVFAVIDLEQKTVISGPSIESRGWVDAEGDHLENELGDLAYDAVVAGLDDGVTELGELERLIRRAVGRHVNARTGRRPMIVPRLIRY